MGTIRVRKGLDIPLKGASEALLEGVLKPPLSALDLSCFEGVKFTLLAKEGERVVIGQPLAEDKACPEKKFVSPSSGILQKVHRGEKRRLLAIEIANEGEEYFGDRQPMKASSREEVAKYLAKQGLFAHIFKRPCHRLADPADKPKSIFIKAVESAPFSPPAEEEMKGYEEEFHHGISVLQKLTEGEVHLVHRPGSAFAATKGTVCHEVVGPHPAGNVSLHIYHIDPIRNSSEVVWTLSVHDVICIGMVCLRGVYHTTRVVSVAGEAILEPFRGILRVHRGISIGHLLRGRLSEEDARVISGNPLTGVDVGTQGFLGFHHNAVATILQPKKREFLRFFKARTPFFTATRTYFQRRAPASFSTLAHGERRAFVDGAIYDRVMPMDIPTMHLIKALLAEDFEKAEELGLLEVDSEDFALASFLCPSKIDMTHIVKEGLMKYVQEYMQ